MFDGLGGVGSVCEKYDEVRMRLPRRERETDTVVGAAVVLWGVGP